MRSLRKKSVIYLFLVLTFIVYFNSYPNSSSNCSAVYTALGNTSWATIEKDVFQPLGLLIVNNEQIIPKLNYISQPKCEEVYSDWLEKSKDHNESAPPPKNIPTKWKRNFTLEGYIHLKMNYMDERSGIKEAKWDMIEEFIKKPFDKFRDEDMSYGRRGIAVYNAFKYHGLLGLEGAVVGSLAPWVEVSALKNGARKITTIEYMKIDVVGTDKVEYMHPVEIAENAARYFRKFDFVVSYSSMEHSGLGRYGDVPDPIGDIREMLKVRCLIKEGGLFFFGVPMGPDALVWNAHRIYGRIRLAIMFAGFEILNIFEERNPNPVEFTEEDFGPNVLLFFHKRQPVFVLRKI